MKVKSSMVYGCRMVVGFSAVDPHDHVADRQVGSLPCSAQERIRPHSTSPGKDPNTKFKVHTILSAYCF